MIYVKKRQVPALLDDHHVDLDDVHSHHDSLLACLHALRIWHQRLQWIISTVMRTQQLQPCRHFSAPPLDFRSATVVDRAL